jgi:hypothetical protein
MRLLPRDCLYSTHDINKIKTIASNRSALCSAGGSESGATEVVDGFESPPIFNHNP